MTVPVPFIGWLWPHNVSYADVDRLMGRERWHLISQERLFDHCVIVAVVWTHFPVTDFKSKRCRRNMKLHILGKSIKRIENML